MNKREKEVIQAQLDSEKKVLEQIEKQYQAALNQVNQEIKLLQADELTQSKVYQLEYQKALKGQISGILEKLHGDEYSTIQQYLTNSYTDSFIGTMYDIAGQGIPLIMPIDQAAVVRAVVLDSKVVKGYYDALGVDINKLKKTINAEVSRGIATGMPYSDIARNINNVSKSGLYNAQRIARTEGHRIQQASAYDAQIAAKKKGADVVKQWDAILDGVTRPTHRKLDGQIKEIDEPFEVDGKKAMYPGEFGDPAEDCNCRCVSLPRARWALDEDELKTLQERAEYFGLDKTDSFEEYKEKYLKASEQYRRKTADDGHQIIDKPTYQRLTKDFVKNGGIVIRGEEAAQHLKDRAYASYLPGMNTAFIRDDATVSDVLEEMYHAKQDKNNSFGDVLTDEVLLRREIDAQNYLISMIERYKIPSEETELTKKNLAYYEQALKHLLEGSE